MAFTKIPPTVYYAIQSLCLLADSYPSKERVLGSALSAACGIPGPYFHRLVGPLLRRANLIHGRRGVRGGYRLARPPSDITLLDIVEAIEGPVSWHGGTNEIVDAFMKEIVLKFRANLKDVTLKDLIDY